MPPASLITGIYERDIDLLLLEEFSSSPNFVKWFAETVTETSLPDLTCLSIEHSATTMNGESDLELTISSPATSTRN